MLYFGIFAAIVVALGMFLGKKKCCCAWYGICMVGALAFTCVNCYITELFIMCGLITRRFAGGWNSLAVSLGWHVNMILCPWITTTPTERYQGNFDKLAEDQRNFVASDAKDNDEKGANIVFLCNHTSFLDTPQYTRLVPSSVVWYCRGYVKASLLKMPLFGRILKGIGHFPVYFASDADGKFSVDKEKMAVVEESVDAHLDAKGVLCLFPEGAINKAPEDGLMSFRYGTFVKALKCNFRLWGFTSINHEKCWPVSAPIGGNPTDMMIDLFPVAPNGVKQLVKDIRAKKLVEGCEKKEDHVVLAEYCHNLMDKEVKDLRAANTSQTSKKKN